MDDFEKNLVNDINIKSLLNWQADQLPPTIKKQLADNRQQALLHLNSRAQLAGNGILSHFYHDYIEPHRLASAALASAVLLGAVLFTHQLGGWGVPVSEDASLLAAELPPEAFVDNGFQTWLASSH